MQEEQMTIVNQGKAVEIWGTYRFPPNEPQTVPAKVAKALLQKPTFAVVSPRFDLDDMASRIEHCFWPEVKIDPELITFTEETFPAPKQQFKKSRRKLSILWVIMALHELPGGTRVIGRIMHYLKRRGHKVSFLLLDSYMADVLEKHYINWEKDNEPPDVVIGTYFKTMLAAQALPGKKVGFIQGDEPAWPWLAPEEIGKAKEAFSLPDWDYITVAPHLAAKCKEAYGSSIWGTLHGNGVDCFDFSPRINDFKLRNAAFTIIRQAPAKGWPVVEQAFAILKSKLGPNFRTMACGFDAFAGSVDSYTTRPTVPMMATLYSSADVYLSASEYEGSPLPPLEAMACGCIPIVTPIGTEEYLQDGVNGFIVDYNSPEQMAERALEIIDNPSLKIKMIYNGLRTAHDRPWDKVALEFESILLKNIGGKRQ